jgi:hypothetical protein
LNRIQRSGSTRALPRLAMLGKSGEGERFGGVVFPLAGYIAAWVQYSFSIGLGVRCGLWHTRVGEKIEVPNRSLRTQRKAA